MERNNKILDDTARKWTYMGQIFSFFYELHCQSNLGILLLVSLGERFELNVT